MHSKAQSLTPCIWISGYLMEGGAGIGDRAGHTNEITGTQNFSRNRAHVHDRKPKSGQRRDRNRLRVGVANTISSERQSDGLNRPVSAFDPRLQSLTENTAGIMPSISASIHRNPQIDDVRALENSVNNLNLRGTLLKIVDLNFF